MITKCSIARKIASQGIDVFIANGTRDSIITDIVRRKEIPILISLPAIRRKLE